MLLYSFKLTLTSSYSLISALKDKVYSLYLKLESSMLEMTPSFKLTVISKLELLLLNKELDKDKLIWLVVTLIPL